MSCLASSKFSVRNPSTALPMNLGLNSGAASAAGVPPLSSKRVVSLPLELLCEQDVPHAGPHATIPLISSSGGHIISALNSCLATLARCAGGALPVFSRSADASTSCTSLRAAPSSSPSHAWTSASRSFPPLFETAC
eukprot:scaffold8290_cov62-Phaeocystis_antarctica.AAC.4